MHHCWFIRYVGCYFIVFWIITPPHANAAKHACTPLRGALGRPPPRVHVPRHGTRALVRQRAHALTISSTSRCIYDSF
eukprot:3015210-Pleurochrysis_carterae.AAC.1